MEVAKKPSSMTARDALTTLGLKPDVVTGTGAPGEEAKIRKAHNAMAAHRLVTSQ